MMTLPGECPAPAKELWHSCFGRQPGKPGNMEIHRLFLWSVRMGNVCYLMLCLLTLIQYTHTSSCVFV